MRDTSRAISRKIEKAGSVRMPREFAASSTPVAEPPVEPGRPKPGPNGRGHATPAANPRPAPPADGGRSPEIPALPPARQAPVRSAPLVLFVAQTFLDMLAIAGAFVLAYWIRFQSDIFRKFVQPDN